MTNFTYPKPTAINWVMVCKVTEQKVVNHCKFCEDRISDGDEILVSTDYDGVTVFHTHHFNRSDNGTT